MAAGEGERVATGVGLREERVVWMRAPVVEVVAGVEVVEDAEVVAGVEEGVGEDVAVVVGRRSLGVGMPVCYKGGVRTKRLG